MAEPNLLDELEKIVALSERATPGPWRTDNHGDDEMQVVGRPSWGCKRFGKKGEWTVAGMDDMVGEHPSEVRANARLIAASVNFLRTHAPALADMAKRMEAAERDARRYRWLRSRVDWKPLPESATGKVYLVATMVSAAYGDVNDQVDAAIDAATQEGEG